MSYFKSNKINNNKSTNFSLKNTIHSTEVKEFQGNRSTQDSKFYNPAKWKSNTLVITFYLLLATDVQKI